MIDRLILFKGEIETLTYFSEQMKETFECLGYKIFVFDYLEAEGSLRYLKKFIQKGKTALVTFNFIGLDDYEVFREKSGDMLWDCFDVLCVNIMVDHPFYYHPILSAMPKCCIQLCIDREHLAYVNRFFPQIRHTGFLPLAGTKFHEDPYFMQRILTERPMDIVFTGNYAAPETFEKHITRIDEEYTEFYYGIINDLIAHPWMSMDACMEKHLLAHLDDEKTEVNIRNSMSAMVFIDLYVRMYFRGQVVRRLVDAGLKVHVFGAGWDKLDCEHPENLIIGKECISADCLEYIANAKISLNVMPWFKDGAHDRIFNTMMNGAVCLTDGSRYLKEEFLDGVDVIYYDLDDLDRVPELARSILSDMEEAKQMVQSGYEKTSRKHTWIQRAETIHNLIQTYKQDI